MLGTIFTAAPLGTVAALLALVLAGTAVPLAVTELRQSRLDRARAALCRPTPPTPPQPSRRQRRARDKFIAHHVRVSAFGDHRRRTAHVTELLRVETGPIETLTFALKDPTEESA